MRPAIVRDTNDPKLFPKVGDVLGNNDAFPLIDNRKDGNYDAD